MAIRAGGSASREDVQRRLESAFSDLGLGEHQIQVRHHQIYQNDLWKTQQGEYEVSIANEGVENDAWWGVVRLGQNDTLEIRQGKGWQVMIGDLLNVGDEGIGSAQADKYMATPYYSGIQSFARRVAAAFGLKAENMRGPGGGSDRYGKNVNALFTEINTNTNPAGGRYVTAAGMDIPNNIPASNVRTSSETSPGQRRFLAYSYNVPLVGKQEKAIPAVERDVQYNPAIDRETAMRAGELARRGWALLFGGGVWRPDKNEQNISGSGGLFITPLAAGTPYWKELANDPNLVQGATAGLTEKFLKQTYVAGRRDINRLVVDTGERLLELTTPEEAERLTQAGQRNVVGSSAVQESSLALRTGEGDFSGIRGRALTALGALPWQSGQMQFALPEALRQQVRSMAETKRADATGGTLQAGYIGRRKFEIEGVNSLQELVNANWQLDQGLQGRKLPHGRKIVFGQWANPNLKISAEDEEGNAIEVDQQDPMSFTTGQQNMAVRGYTMYIPQKWVDTPEKRMALGEQLQALARRGVTIDTHAGDMVTLDVETLSATPGGVKGAGAKGSMNLLPLGADRIGTQVEGVQAPSGIAYDVLQNAKGLDPVMLNALQAMPRTGENNLYDFLGTLYRGDEERSGMIEMMRDNTGADQLDFQQMAQLLGMQTGEHLLRDVTSRTLQDRRNRKGELVPTPFAEIDQEFNNELYQRFGVGRVMATVPVETYQTRDIPKLRESWIQAQMAGQFDKETNKQTVAPLSKEAAEAAWEQYMVPNLEERVLSSGESITTLMQRGEFFVAPKLSTLVAEPSGVGSDQGDILNALKAQKHYDLAEWFAGNYSRMFRDTPSREAIQNITGAYLQTQAGGKGLAPAPGSAITIGEGGIDPEALQQVVAARLGEEETGNPIDRLQIWEDAIREMGKVGPDVPIDRLYLPKQQMIMAGPRHWSAVESNRWSIAEQGGLEAVPQAHATTRALRILESGVAAEALGEMDLINREESIALQNQYVNSEQMRKARGLGIFARFGGSPYVRPGWANLSYQGLQRMYELGGGDVRNAREFRQFIRAAQGTPAMVFRQPGPNIGTEEAPGSYQVMRMQTPLSRTGARIEAAFEQEGLGRPDVILPQQYTANFGDLDYDPSSIFPMLYRRRTGIMQHRWVPYRPKDYNRAMREIEARSDPALQRASFERVFGERGSSFNPLDENMRLALQNQMGVGGEALLKDRLPTEIDSIQEKIHAWNAVKQVQMGATYNSFFRRPQAALTALGAPSEFLPNVRDPGAYWYQQAIDFTKVFSQWQGMMNTAGFFAKNGSLQWGWNQASEGKPDWNMDMWTPTQRDSSSRSFVTGLGTLLASDPNARPEWVAGMLMNVPNRPEGISDKDWSRQLRKRQLELTQRLEPLMTPIEGESKTSQKIRLQSGIAALAREDNPLIGEDSAAVYSAMARSFEYAQATPERWNQFTQEIERMGGFNWKGQRLNADEAAQLFKPVTMMYQFSLNKPNKNEWMGILEMSDQFLRAREGGYAGSQIIQEMWRSYGQAVGLNNPMEALPNPVDPNTGLPVEIQNIKQLESLREAYAANQQKLVDAFYNGNQGGVRNLSFSSVGAEAQIAESGDLYEDSYRRALTSGALYGWRNPAIRGTGNVTINTPQQLLGSRGSNALFLQNSRATATGNDVEAAAARVIGAAPDFARRFGAHIGQMPAGAEPRYQVTDEEGRSYRIAGIPDFLRLQETAEGAFDLTVNDWKNLPSQAGKTPQEIAQYVQDNPAYMTQLPGYMQMYAQPERFSEKEWKNFLKALPKNDRPIWERFRQSGLEGTRTAPVQTHGAFLVSTFSTQTPKSEYMPKIAEGLSALSQGQESPYVQAVPVSDQEMTLENIAAGDVALAQKAAQATQLGRMTALEAAQYQSYVMKEYLNSNPQLREQFLLGDTKLEPTQDELQAKEKWFAPRRAGETVYRNEGWSYNPAREEDFAETYNKIQTQISTLSAGTYQPQPIAHAPGARSEAAQRAAARNLSGEALPAIQINQEARARDVADIQATPEYTSVRSRIAAMRAEQYDEGPEVPINRTRAPVAQAGLTGEALQQAITGMQSTIISTVHEIMQGQQGSGGRFFGGKRLGGEEANDLFKKMRMMSDEMIGQVTPDETGALQFRPGQFLQTFAKLPQRLASYFPQEVAQQILEAGRTDPAQGVKLAQTKALSMGVDISGAFQGGDWQKFMNQYKAFKSVSGKLSGNLGAVDQDMLNDWLGGRDILGALTGKDQGVQALPQVAAPMMTMNELTSAMRFRSAGGSRKGDVSLTDEQRASTVSGTMDFFRLRENLRGMEEDFYRIGPGLDRFRKHFKDVDDAITNADKHSEAYKRVSSSLNEMNEGRTKVQRLAVDARAQFDMPGRGLLSDQELVQMASSVSTERQQKALEKYQREVIQQQERENRIGGILTGKGPEAPQMGRLFRSMLGGFGMMYVRSVANIAAEPTRFGYEAYNQQEDIVRQAQLSGFGATGLQVSPDAYNQRMTAMYGGAGWAAFQRMRGQVLAENPSQANMVNLGAAGLGGAGLFTTMGMWAGAGMGALSLAPVTAALAIGGAANAQMYGARTEVDRNLTGTLAQVMSGRLGYSTTREALYRPDLLGQPLGNARATLAELFNWNQYGLQNPEQVKMMNQLEQLRKYEQGGGQNLRGFLGDQGLSSREINRLMGIYSSAQMQQFPEFSTQALAQAANLRDQYGLGFAQSDKQGQLGIIAGWYEGGIDVEKVARQMAYSPNLSIDEQRRRAGEIVKNLAARQESGGQILDAAELERLQGGAERWNALGAFAPTNLRIEEATPGRMVTRKVPGPTVTQYVPDENTPMGVKAIQVPGSEREEQYYEPGKPGVNELQDYQAKLQGLTQNQWQAFMARWQNEQEKALLGMKYQMPAPEEYGGEWDQQRTIEEMRKSEAEGYRTNALRQYRQTMLGFGINVTAPEMENMTNLEIMQRTQRMQQGYSVGMNLMEGGIAPQLATQMGLALGQMPAQMSNRYQAILQGNPLEMGRYALANPNRWANLPITMPGAGGVEIPTAYLAMTDYKETFQELQGGERRGFQEPGQLIQKLEMTGLPWGTNSLAMPGITSRQNAANIWGTNWQNRTDLDQGMVNALIEGGQWGLQQYQINQQHQLAQRGVGIQAQQMQLQKAFQTGVGIQQYAGTVNPVTGQPFGFNTGPFSFSAMGQSYTSQGGGMWGLEDVMRQMGYAQSEWQMDFQRRQSQMQSRQWEQNMSLNRRQSLMQRGWTQEDWGYQDQMRNMQWGWKVEDYEEQKRFATGRDRRLMERQMRRETVVHDAEGEQIDRQRTRQQELWRLEDQRYTMSKRHHAEQVQMEQESQKAQREFYEERKRLEQEQVKIQRAYQIEQMKLQEAQLGVQQQQLELQRQQAQTTFELSKFSESAAAKGKLFNVETMAALATSILSLDPAFKNFVEAVQQLQQAVGNQPALPPTSGSGGGSGNRPRIPRANGGLVTPGQEYDINEREPEVLQVGTPGTVIPLSRLDPWQSQTIINTPTTEKSRPTQVAIYIGGQHFKDIILDTVDKEVRI